MKHNFYSRDVQVNSLKKKTTQNWYTGISINLKKWQSSKIGPHEFLIPLIHKILFLKAYHNSNTLYMHYILTIHS